MASAEASADGASARVRVADPVVREMRALPRGQAAATARAIAGIGPDMGVPLRIPQPDQPGRRYLALVPGDPELPVIVYRPLTAHEGAGYFVAALASRDAYAAYREAEQSGLLDTELGRALLAQAQAPTGTGTGADGCPARFDGDDGP
jgi:hypothetical protein